MDISNKGIGNLIKDNRKKLNLTQKELADGIISTSKLSLLEKDKQIPYKYTFLLLLERLKLDKNKYLPLLDSNDFEFEELKYKIEVAMMNHNDKEVKQLLDDIRKLKDGNKEFKKQFIMQMEALSNKNLSLEEQYLYFKKAICLTCPDFDEDNIKNLALYKTEINIIMNIAECYSDMGKKGNTISIYRQLLEYVENNLRTSDDIASLLILISFNYSKILNIAERYKEAIEVADKGINCSVKYNRMNLLGKLLTNKAYSLCERNCMLEGKLAYKKALAFFFSIGQEHNMKIVIENARQFDIILDLDLR